MTRQKRVHGGMALEPQQPTTRDRAAVTFLRSECIGYLRGERTIDELERAIGEAKQALVQVKLDAYYAGREAAVERQRVEDGAVSEAKQGERVRDPWSVGTD